MRLMVILSELLSHSATNFKIFFYFVIVYMDNNSDIYYKKYRKYKTKYLELRKQRQIPCQFNEESLDLHLKKMGGTKKTEKLKLSIPHAKNRMGM